MNKRLFIIFLLGFSSGLPMALVGGTLQAWYADSGMTVFITGSLSLISFPYAFRLIWGPLLDRYSLNSLGKRRSWIFAMQCVLLVGFNCMAWFTPQQYPGFLAFLALMLACCSATQDIAVDAHRAEYLAMNEYALGTSLAVLGYRFALLLSGGLALVMAQHWGWAYTYRTMGLMIFLGMIAVWCSKEPHTPKQEASSFTQAFVAPFKDLFARPDITYFLLFIFCYKLGEMFTSSTSGIVIPFLIQGLGFSLETIGYINKILGVCSILLGGISAGILLLRVSLFHALLVLGLFQVLTNMLYLGLALVGKNTVFLALAVFFDNFIVGMASTALVALFMRSVNKKYTGTQFSFLVAFSTTPRVFSGPIAALIQKHVGWVGLYQLSIVCALLFVPFLLRIRQYTQEAPRFPEGSEGTPAM